MEYETNQDVGERFDDLIQLTIYLSLVLQIEVLQYFSKSMSGWVWVCILAGEF